MQDVHATDLTTARGRFQQRFGPGRILLAVIHVTDDSQAHRNAAVAAEAGADGVFLIDHGNGPGDDHLARRLAPQVAAAHPGWFVGVNLLSLIPAAAAVTAAHLDGIWCDDAGTDERTDAQPSAEALSRTRAGAGFDGLYFGGVAFKYRRPATDLEAAGRIAAAHMDVVCTSGDGTGSAPPADKLARLRAGVGDHPLAVASGITPDNAGELVPAVDAVLAATGISRDFHTLDPVRCAALAEVVHDL